MHALLQALCRIENLFLDPHHYLANLSSRQKLYRGMASKQICLFKARVLQKKKHPWIISFLQFAQSNLCVCLKSNNKHIIQSK